MANTVITLKKSSTPTAQPTVLANGELAINYADGKLFYKHANGTILPFNTQGGNAFGTINANGTLVVAGSSESVVTLIAGNNISIGADAINDTITINSTGGAGGGVTVATSQIKDLTSNDYVVTNVANIATVVDSSVAIAAFNQANTLTTFTSNVGNGSANAFNVSHNLSSFWLLTSVREYSTGDIVYPDMRQTTANNLVISFVDNPTANQYALLVAKVA
jgi:hypothetical protein